MNAYMKRFARLVPMAALAVILGACAGTQHTKSTGEYVDDAAITAKVKSA